MNTAFNLAIEIANKVTAEEFFSYYASAHNYNITEDPMRIRELKTKLWGQRFGDKFSNDSDVPLHIKQLHKKVFEASYGILLKK